MMDGLINGAVAVAVAVVGVAFLAVLVSRNSNTANIIGASGSALGNSLLAAEAPVLGQTFLGLGNNQFGPGYYG